MAILKPRLGHLGLLLVPLLVPACESVPPVTRTPTTHQDIGWIDRQFKVCAGEDCPAPTRKTLAVLELPVAYKKPEPSVAEASQAATPFVSQDEPLTAIVHFAFSRRIPSAEGQRALQRLARIASRYQRIELQGRTDDLGRKSYNDRLARQRAEYVRSWLVARGIQAEMTVRAEGLCCYLDAAHTEAARQSNRRVEVRFAERRDGVSNHKGGVK